MLNHDVLDDSVQVDLVLVIQFHGLFKVCE